MQIIIYYLRLIVTLFLNSNNKQHLMHLKGRFSKNCSIFILFKYRSTIYTANVENTEIKLYKKIFQPS